MEVVFSSIRATHYFYARMIGLFGVIFTHIGIYAVGLGGVWIFSRFHSSCERYFISRLTYHPTYWTIHFLEYLLLYHSWNLHVRRSFSFPRVNSCSS